MQFLVEFKSFYKVGDLVLIEYWYDDLITPVRIEEILSTRSFRVTHHISQSEIFNAPEEIIKSSDIIDRVR